MKKLRACVCCGVKRSWGAHEDVSRNTQNGLLETAGLGVTLSTKRGPIGILSGVSVSVCRGEFLAVIGGSGAGKPHCWTQLHREGEHDVSDDFYASY